MCGKTEAKGLYTGVKNILLQVNKAIMQDMPLPDQKNRLSDAV